MFIYHSTLSKGNSYTHAVAGNFSGLNEIEIVVSRNRVLELLSATEDGRMYMYCSEDINTRIRSMVALRMPEKDYIAISSDSGYVLILQYDAHRNFFSPVFKKKYGMPVCLPEHPGQYIAISMAGVAVGSLAENHIFYSFHKDHKDKPHLFIQERKYIMYDLVGVEAAGLLPTFASLEVLIEDGVYDPSKLTQYLKIYEVDFRAQKIASKQSYPLPHHGNKLIFVPKGKVNPYGLLICYGDMLTFKPLEEGYEDVTRYLPQRKNDAFETKYSFLVTSSVIHKVETVVVMVQSDQGDLFTVEIEEYENKDLDMVIIYVDTIPVASAMCLLSSVRLFVAPEFGDNFLYEITCLGDECEMIPFEEGEVLVTFEPRKLTNLKYLSRLESISPVMQSYVSDLAYNDLKTFIFACGRGPSSTLRLKRFGVKVSTVHPITIPQLSNAVWCVIEKVSGGHEITYIVVSLVNATMVLALDEYMYVDKDNAFEYKYPTLGCHQCSNNSIIQVNPTGFRHIRGHQFTEYKTSKKKMENEKDILRCALYGHQIAVALVNKEGRYYEVVDDSGKVSFNEIQTKTRFKSTVMCMEFLPKAEKAKHLAVCFQDSLEIYSVDLKEMKCVTTYNLEHIPESLGIVSCMEEKEEFNSIITIGFQDGTLQRIALYDAKIKCEYSMKLGTKPVKLSVGQIQNNCAVVALTNRAWISFRHQARLFTFAPLDFDQIDDVAFFSARCSPQANMLAMSNKKLFVLSVNHWESLIDGGIIRLNYTPNIMAINPSNNFIIISETEKRLPYHKRGEMNPQQALDLAMNPPITTTETDLEQKKVASVWNSLVHIVDPTEKEIVFKHRLERNKAAVSMILTNFGKEGGPQYLLIGCKQGLKLLGLSSESFVYTYEVSKDGKSFSLITKIVVEDIPAAICELESYVLIAVGSLLCLYSFDHDTKELKKTDVEESSQPIIAIWSRKNFFVVETADERITYGYLDRTKATLNMIHQDRFMRLVTCLCFWDDDVIFVGDRKSITAVLLPYYEGCKEEESPDEPSVEELMERINITDPDPSSSEDNELTLEELAMYIGTVGSSSQEECSAPKKICLPAPAFKIKQVPKAAQSSQAGPSTSKAGPSYETVPLASEAGPSAQAGPSSQAGQSSQAAPSTSESGPSTSGAASSSETVPSTSKAKPCPSGSVLEDVYHYPFLRFKENSYFLVEHKVGEYVRSVQKTSLINEGRELIVYTTMSGAVGVLVPFLTETPHKLFAPLEYLIYKTDPLLASDWLQPLNPEGEDIYAKCHDDQITVDGSKCEKFRQFLRDEQHDIAKKLGMSVLEIFQKLEEMKTTVYF